MAGTPLKDTRLGRVCPEILEDLRKVITTRKQTQRILSFPWRTAKQVIPAALLSGKHSEPSRAQKICLELALRTPKGHFYVDCNCSHTKSVGKVIALPKISGSPQRHWFLELNRCIHRRNRHRSQYPVFKIDAVFLILRNKH